MAIKLEDYLAKLPAEERAEVEASMARAVEREASLRQPNDEAELAAPSPSPSPSRPPLRRKS